MFKAIEFISEHWQKILLVLSILFIFPFVKIITDFLRNVKDGMKEIFTPLGFIVFLCLIAFVVFLVFVYKGTFNFVVFQPFVCVGVVQ